MKRLAYAFAASILLSGFANAQQAGLAVATSPIPIWPADGVIPTDLNDHYAFLDVNAGEMVLVYPSNLGRSNFQSNPGTQVVQRIALTNQARPSVSVSVQQNGNTYRYKYRLANAKQALQPIRRFDLVTPEMNEKDTAVTPPNWSSSRANGALHANSMLAAMGAISGPTMRWQIGAAGIAPGAELDGFQLTSPLKPGLTMALAAGGQDLPSLSANLPRAVLDQAEPMLKQLSGHARTDA